VIWRRTVLIEISTDPIPIMTVGSISQSRI